MKKYRKLYLKGQLKENAKKIIDLQDTTQQENKNNNQ